MHDYMYICIYLCVCVCIYVCIGVCTCAFMCTCGYMCLVTCYHDVDLFVHSKPGNRRPKPDLDLCSLWTRYVGDLKTDPWDDPKIRTSSCSEDQTAIQFQNRVILYVFTLVSFSQFIVVSSVYMLLELFHVTICFILPV